MKKNIIVSLFLMLFFAQFVSAHAGKSCSHAIKTPADCAARIGLLEDTSVSRFYNNHADTIKSTAVLLAVVAGLYILYTNYSSVELEEQE